MLSLSKHERGWGYDFLRDHHTFTHVVDNLSAGSNRILIVGVSYQYKAGDWVSGVTYNGVPMVPVQLTGAAPYAVNANDLIMVQMFYLVNPQQGSHSVVVIMVKNSVVTIGAASFFNVHQTVPLGTPAAATGNSNSATVTVPGVNAGEVVIDTLGADNGVVANTSVGGGQTQLWKRNDLGPLGAGSGEPSPAGTGNNVAMSWSWTGSATWWAIGAVALKPVKPTAVRLDFFRARAYGDLVQLEWRTGYELNNHGFHLYREDGGGFVRLTPQLVAGSALLAGHGTVLKAGRQYTWPDTLPEEGSRAKYWLEDVDIEGGRSWHGPVFPETADGPPAQKQAILLSRLGRESSPVKGKERPSVRRGPGRMKPGGARLFPERSFVSPAQMPWRRDRPSRSA